LRASGRSRSLWSSLISPQRDAGERYLTTPQCICLCCGAILRRIDRRRLNHSGAASGEDRACQSGRRARRRRDDPHYLALHVGWTCCHSSIACLRTGFSAADALYQGSQARLTMIVEAEWNRRLGRGFDSRRLHHKHIGRSGTAVRGLGDGPFVEAMEPSGVFSMGAIWVRLGVIKTRLRLG
jgi:hypothetical protein